MVEEAVRSGIAENEQLDWKRCLPQHGDHPKGEDWNASFAKDIAAMANSGGGMLIYGVQEQQAKAYRIDGVNYSDLEQRNLRRAIANNIHPPVYGVLFKELQDEAKSTTVLSIQVPSSPDTPHMYFKTGQDHLFQAPKRFGSQTIPMPEREIERHYRQRFELKVRREESIDLLLNLALKNTSSNTSSPWLVAVARPVSPENAPKTRMLPHRSKRIVDDARMSRDMFAKKGIFIPLDAMNDAFTMAGLRRWVYRYPNPTDVRSTLDKLLAEIHSDGSVTMALAAGGLSSNESPIKENEINSKVIEGFIADFVSLVVSTGKELSLPSTYEIALTIKQSDKSATFIRLVNYQGRFLDNGYQHPISDFIPVAAEFQYDSDAMDIRTVMTELAFDAIAQVGLNKLTVFRTAGELMRIQERAVAEENFTPASVAMMKPLQTVQSD
jgi:hypothetical protein